MQNGMEHLYLLLCLILGARAFHIQPGHSLSSHSSTPTGRITHMIKMPHSNENIQPNINSIHNSNLRSLDTFLRNSQPSTSLLGHRSRDMTRQSHEITTGHQLGQDIKNHHKPIGFRMGLQPGQEVMLRSPIRHISKLSPEPNHMHTSLNPKNHPFSNLQTESREIHPRDLRKPIALFPHSYYSNLNKQYFNYQSEEHPDKEFSTFHQEKHGIGEKFSPFTNEDSRWGAKENFLPQHQQVHSSHPFTHAEEKNHPSQQHQSGNLYPPQSNSEIGKNPDLPRKQYIPTTRPVPQPLHASRELSFHKDSRQRPYDYSNEEFSTSPPQSSKSPGDPLFDAHDQKYHAEVFSKHLEYPNSNKHHSKHENGPMLSHENTFSTNFEPSSTSDQNYSNENGPPLTHKNTFSTNFGSSPTSDQNYSNENGPTLSHKNTFSTNFGSSPTSDQNYSNENGPTLSHKNTFSTNFGSSPTSDQNYSNENGPTLSHKNIFSTNFGSSPTSDQNYSNENGPTLSHKNTFSTNFGSSPTSDQNYSNENGPTLSHKNTFSTNFGSSPTSDQNYSNENGPTLSHKNTFSTNFGSSPTSDQNYSNENGPYQPYSLPSLPFEHQRSKEVGEFGHIKVGKSFEEDNREPAHKPAQLNPNPILRLPVQIEHNHRYAPDDQSGRPPLRPRHSPPREQKHHQKANSHSQKNPRNSTLSIRPRNEDTESLESDSESDSNSESDSEPLENNEANSQEEHDGFLDMGAYTDTQGSFGWYADFPVGRGHDKMSYS